MPVLDSLSDGRVTRIPPLCSGKTVAWIVSFASIASFSAMAAAHGLGMSDLRFHAGAKHLEGEWELTLADARNALALDPSKTGDVALAELRGHEADLRAYVVQHLAITTSDRACPVAASAPLGWRSDTGHVVASVSADCPSEPQQLTMRCELLFDRDPKHRVYFSVEDARSTHVGAFRSDRRSATIELKQFHVASGFFEFVGDGVEHIWSGIDHLLFVIALLLPAPLERTSGTWARRPHFGLTLREIVKVVTAFTVAHSISLALGFFGLVVLPARWVEATIAFSIFAAAWNNLRPFIPGRSWVIALGFGLVHGLGFAGALRNLAIPLHARGIALAGFNVGVELGQLALVALALPLLYAASRRPWYPRRVMGAGSFAVAWLAVVWTLERAFSLSI
jgi:hypothetical protein